MTAKATDIQEFEFGSSLPVISHRHGICSTASIQEVGQEEFSIQRVSYSFMEYRRAREELFQSEAYGLLIEIPLKQPSEVRMNACIRRIRNLQTGHYDCEAVIRAIKAVSIDVKQAKKRVKKWRVPIEDIPILHQAMEQCDKLESEKPIALAIQ